MLQRSSGICARACAAATSSHKASRIPNTTRACNRAVKRAAVVIALPLFPPCGGVLLVRDFPDAHRWAANADRILIPHRWVLQLENCLLAELALRFVSAVRV